MHTQPVATDVFTALAAATAEARSGQCPGAWYWSVRGGWSSLPIHDQRWWVGGIKSSCGNGRPFA